MANYARIGAGWKKKTQDGKPFVSFSFKDRDYALVLVNNKTKEKIKLEGATMFSNDHKSEDKHPDFVINAKISD